MCCPVLSLGAFLLVLCRRLFNEVVVVAVAVMVVVAVKGRVLLVVVVSSDEGSGIFSPTQNGKSKESGKTGVVVVVAVMKGSWRCLW